MGIISFTFVFKASFEIDVWILWLRSYASDQIQQGHLEEKLLQGVDFKNIVKCREVVKKFIDFLKLITPKKKPCKESVFKVFKIYSVE